MIIRTKLLSTALALCAASAFAANNPPLSGAWNIQPTGSAASNGELLFRMTPGDGGDPVEVTVSVLSGASDIAIARDIRRTLSRQLRADQFNVQLGQGANVLVTDPRGKPNFSLELIDSDVENLRVVVQSVTPTASPTVPEQQAPVPVAPANGVPAGNTAPGNALPPATPAPGNSVQPAAPPPANSPPVPNPSPPPNATPGGAPADEPPPIATPADAPPPIATPGGSSPTGAPPPT